MILAQPGQSGDFGALLLERSYDMDKAVLEPNVSETLTMPLYLLSCVAENLRFHAKDLSERANELPALHVGVRVFTLGLRGLTHHILR